MSKLKYIEELVDGIVGDKIKAQMVVERLRDEGLLIVGYGDADIDRVISKFGDTFGTTKATKQDRFAASRMVKTYGAQSLVTIIQLLGEHRDEKYAPLVGSVKQLEDKIVSVISFLRKLGTDTVIKV